MTTRVDSDARVSIAIEETVCPLCGSASASKWLERGDLLHGCPGTYGVVRCRDCGHVYTSPRPTPHSLPVCYPESYAPYHANASSSRSAVKSRLRSLAPLRRAVHWFLDSGGEWIPPRGESAKALEIGCGHGAFLQRLSDAGWDAEGLEPSAAAVAQAQSRGLRVQHGSLESTALPAQHYDAVFLWMVLEHLPDPLAGLRQIRESLKPGGWIVLSVPNAASWEPRVFGRYWHAWDLPRHLQHFSPRTVRGALHASGFGDIRIIHQRTLLNVTGSLGLLLRECFPQRFWGPRLLAFTDDPTAPGLLMLSPFAKVLAWLRQGGSIRVIARNAVPAGGDASGKPRISQGM